MVNEKILNVTSVTLEGKNVRLEPLSFKYENDLLAAAQPDEIWEYIGTFPGQTRQDMHAWIEKALHQVEIGERIWFVIVHKGGNRVIGATSYMEIQRRHRGLEIGGTWLNPEFWGSIINTECKYLMLRHAFEELGCLRVQIKTDLRNVRSQRAIEKLGAVKEGVLRKHMVTRTGFVRDSVMYSIIESEWPAVKARLEEKLSMR